MAEWLKAHAWKACLLQGNVGSNPTLSAITLLPKTNIGCTMEAPLAEPFEGVRRGNHTHKLSGHNGLRDHRGWRVEATVLN